MRRSWRLVGLLVWVAGAAWGGTLQGRAGPYHLTIAISPDPPTVGANEFTIEVSEARGRPVADATVSVTATLEAQEAQPTSATLRALEEPGVYFGALDLPQRGRYTVIVQVDGAAGRHTDRFTLITGNPVHQLPAAGLRAVWIWGILLVALPLLVQFLPRRVLDPKRKGFVAGVLLLICAFFLARAIVVTFRRPGQMSVVEAQAMDMTAMVPPVGVVPVAVETVELAEFQGGVRYSGSVVPFNEQEVRARVTGRIVDMPVYPGDSVNQGDVLVRLDTQELASRENEAVRAHLAAQQTAGAARSEAAQARARIAEAQAAADAAGEAIAQNRAARAAAEAAVEQAQRDLAADRARVREAESAVAEARAGAGTATAGVAESRAARETASNQVETARRAVIEAREQVQVAERGVAEAERQSEAARARRAAAEARLTAARANLPQAEATVAEAAAQVEYWRAELPRMAALLEMGAVSQEEYDEEKSRRDQAVARLERTRAEVVEVRGEIEAQEANVAEADAQLEAARQRRQGAEAQVRAARARVAQAEAAVETQASQVGERAAGIESRQRAVTEAEQAIASREAAVERLTAEVAAGQAAVAQAQRQVEVRQAAIEQAVAERQRALANVTAARSAAQAAAERADAAAETAAGRRAAAFTASTIAGYTTLRADLNGVVTARNVTPPTLVQPGDLMLTIAEIDRVRLQANVAAGDAERISVGAPVEVVPTKDPSRSTQARVTAVFPAADPSSRTTIVEAEVANPDRFYLPGDSVTLRIGTGTTAEELTVPSEALVQVTAEPGAVYGETVSAVWTVLGGGGGKTEYYCTMHPEVVSDEPGLCPKCNMDLVPRQVGGGAAEAKTEYYCTMHPEVVSDEPGLCPKCNMELVPRVSGGAAGEGEGIAHLVRVEVGRRTGDRVAIRSGLEPGDQVIYRGHEHLEEGMRVSTTTWAEVSVPAVGAVLHEPGSGGDDGGGMSMPGMDH